jgi:hypothetical protein
MLRLAPVTNLERMYALDEAWNARDWDTFDAYHEQSDVVVYWPGREGTPTQGGRDHRAESIRFCAAFPDNKVKHPYDILFGDGEFTAFVTRRDGKIVEEYLNPKTDPACERERAASDPVALVLLGLLGRQLPALALSTGAAAIVADGLGS